MSFLSLEFLGNRLFSADEILSLTCFETLHFLQKNMITNKKNYIFKKKTLKLYLYGFIFTVLGILVLLEVLFTTEQNSEKYVHSRQQLDDPIILQ